MSRILVDFHHSSLLRSHVLLFQDRLHMELYRPIGMEWFEEGFWAINNQRDTARQFLDPESQPLDNTSPLNTLEWMRGDGTVEVLDPGAISTHMACTLNYFKTHSFDYVLASIPAHVPLFKKLIAQYQPNAKLIVQMGNNWPVELGGGHNVLASIAPQFSSENIFFYHQEFDLQIFHPTPVQPARKIYSFVNVIKNYPQAWSDYTEMRKVMGLQGWEFKSFGGQCPDGNMNGAAELASKMREAALIFHVKPGGDGYGHVIHNAYAVGRPIITRPSHYRGQLAEQLLVPGTFIDLDRYGRTEIKNILNQLMLDPDSLVDMGKMAVDRFNEVVNFQKESEDIAEWLKTLL